MGVIYYRATFIPGFVSMKHAFCSHSFVRRAKSYVCSVHVIYRRDGSARYASFLADGKKWNESVISSLGPFSAVFLYKYMGYVEVGCTTYRIKDGIGYWFSIICDVWAIVRLFLLSAVRGTLFPNI